MLRCLRRRRSLRAKKKMNKEDVVELLGLATGCIGMGLGDFERCTPSEFCGIVSAWRRERELKERQDWERVRMLALVLLQPRAGKRLEATDVMRFGWDGEHVAEVAEREALTDEEVMARYEAALKARGLR